jgi:F0F1-type ATP synthase gamma subunit
MIKFFDEFTTTEMREVEKLIAILYKPSYASIEIDKNNDFVALTYSGLITYQTSTHRNIFISPTSTIKVTNMFDILITGVEPEATNLIQEIISNYLSINLYK